MAERKQQKCGGGGGKKKIEMLWWWWQWREKEKWYIVSLFTKLKNIVECRVEVGSMQGRHICGWKNILKNEEEEEEEEEEEGIKNNEKEEEGK